MAARKRQGPNSDSEAMPQARWRGFHWLHVCQWSERANPATQGLMSPASCWLLVLVLAMSTVQVSTSRPQATSPPGARVAIGNVCCLEVRPTELRRETCRRVSDAAWRG